MRLSILWRITEIEEGVIRRRRLHFWRHRFINRKILPNLVISTLVMVNYAGAFSQSEPGKYFEWIILINFTLSPVIFIVLFYYSFKIFTRFWLAKSTRIIHHNQLLMTNFGRILRLMNRWRQKCTSICTLFRTTPKSIVHETPCL